jgi:probable phosphoglycerate mutase
MSRLLLIRHGATAWSGVRYCGRTDLPLSPRGRAQALAVAARLQHELAGRWRIYTSPLRRARETAEVFAVALGGPISVDAGLSEVDFGEAEGATFKQLEQRWPEIACSLVTAETGIDWPGGESSCSLRTRVEATWRRLAHADLDDRILVTHGGPARLILDLALGTLPRSGPRSLAPGQLVVLRQGETWRVAEVWPP